MSNFDLQFIEQFSSVGAFFYEPSMPSTSDVAKEKILENPPTHLPFLVLCDQQTAGRGQPGKSWVSDSQSLTFTWCVAAGSLPAANHPLLPLIAGASVCEAIDSTGIEGAKLKWPNDVLVDCKKVCGILVEKISAHNQAWFLIGIGINVNQTSSEIESFNCDKSRFPPASLSGLAGKDFILQNFLETVVQLLNQNAFMKDDWKRNLRDRFEFLGEQVKVRKPDGKLTTGVFRGVDETGRLRIECGGEILVLASGQIL